MEELISRIVANIGIDSSLARTAVGILLNMFLKHGDSGAVGKLMAALPGAGDLAATAAKSIGDGAPAGGIGGLMGMAAGLLGGKGGGLMEAVGQLSGAGLSMDQAKGVGDELLQFARQKAGDDVVTQLASSIPGLDKLL